MNNDIYTDLDNAARDAAARNDNVRYIVIDRSDRALSVPTADYEKARKIAARHGAIVRIASTVHAL